MAPGVTERELADRLADAFRLHFKQGYSYRSEGGWDVRNERYGEYNTYHYPTTDRPYRIGDHVCRGTSGASFRGFMGDVDRMWYLGRPPDPVRKWHRWAFECNRAMTAAIRPGARCSDIYNAGARIDLAFGLPPPASGRRGHGLRHIGNLSVHQDNHTILEPGMIISVEPMHGNKYGYFDLEDQHLVTATGVECLHEPASDVLPCIEV